jgi:aspartate/methionine/tyrosine aminotransferase
MLDKAKSLLQPSARSAVPPFMVMDVMAAAARLEAQGRRIVHMEVGQPAAKAPAAAIAAARAALSKGALGYTETLGLGSLRERISRAYGEWHSLDIDPQRIVVTTGSSAGFILAFLAAFEPGDRVAMALPGYPPYRHILNALGCEAVGIETTADTRWSITIEGLLAEHRKRPIKGLIVASPANPTGTMMSGSALAELIRSAEDAGIAVISDEIYHGLDYAFAAESAARTSSEAIIINSFSKYFCMTGWRIGWMVVPPALVRAVERLQQNLAISVPTLSQIAAEAAFDGRSELEKVRQGYQENRRLLLEGLPPAGLASFLPADGAFYLYADVSRLSTDSFAFATRMLEEAGVAVTPGIDFDPLRGNYFVRLCYAGSGRDMREAVQRIGAWLKA